MHQSSSASILLWNRTAVNETFVTAHFVESSNKLLRKITRLLEIKAVSWYHI